MPRVYRPHSASPAELKRRIEQVFETDALLPFRNALYAILAEHEGAVKAGATPAFGAIEALVARYESLMPGRRSDRFMLDSWLIQDLAASWSTGPIKFPGTILPLYGNEWSWQRLPWIGEQDRSGQRVYGITFKGLDQLGSVHLLAYPWVFHELGHGLFAKTSSAILQKFVDAVEDYCRPILRKILADSHQVRALNRTNIERIRQRWLPRGDQQSWIHELAGDIFALWTCGPAFLAAVMDAVDTAHLDPFLIESFHPPYALRVQMLLLAAKELGWENEAGDLATLATRWDSQKSADAGHNQYIAVAPRELRDEALTWSLAACRTWRLPKCDRQMLRMFAERRRNNQPVDSAVELIISAWLIFEDKAKDYAAWESQVVRSLFGELSATAQPEIDRFR